METRKPPVTALQSSPAGSVSRHGEWWFDVGGAVDGMEDLLRRTARMPGWWCGAGDMASDTDVNQLKAPSTWRSTRAHAMPEGGC